MTANLIKVKPYIRAIFNLAYQTRQLAAWENKLQNLSLIVNECQEKSLLDSPYLNLSQKLSFFAAVIEQAPEIINLLKVLAKSKKLLFLPEIANGYHRLFLAQERILEVKVVAALALSIAQKEQLLATLTKSYPGYQFLLEYGIDPEIIGGAMIYLGDRVIDGSIKGFLARLQYSLLLGQ